MATRPELHRAVAKTKSKASDYNDNFDLMMDFVDNSIDESKTYVEGFMPEMTGHSGGVLQTNGTTASWSTAPTILQTIYPVGSIYIGTMETCPLAALFGTWTKKGEGRVLQGSDSSHNAGSTIAAGLPNITGDASIGRAEGLSWQVTNTSGALYKTTSRNGITESTSSSSSKSGLGLSASRSNSIYGNSSTVQPPAYVVNIWERTA